MSVDIHLVVPSTNTDGTRPANVERVDVYGLTGPASVTDDQILKLGAKVGSVNVKAPRNPNDTVDPDEPIDAVEPPVGSGLDQGATGGLKEELTPAAMIPVDLSRAAARRHRCTARPGDAARRSASDVLSRTYVGVGVNAADVAAGLQARRRAARAAARTVVGAARCDLRRDRDHGDVDAEERRCARARGRRCAAGTADRRRRRRSRTTCTM